MPLTQTDAKTLVLAKVGDPDNLIVDNWDLLWNRHKDKGDVQYLYIVIDACDLYLGSVRTSVQFTADGLSVHLEELTANLRAIKQAALDEIKRYRASQGPAVGVLTTNTLLPGYTGFPDPNAQTYIGDPRLGRNRGSGW